ncbi:MAG: hypothetical protein KDJ52_06330 [Anaerolineae bacterium]|nr:hypothetical protein [Anaerolineae bacterium]
MRLKWWILCSLLLAVASFLFLYYIIHNIWPNPTSLFAPPQLLLLSSMFMGLSSATVPVTAYLNYRFAKPDWYSRDKSRLLRQGAWVGLLGVLLAYIQLLRAFNWAVAVVLVGVFIFIELFFLTRE